jgi:tetratricopeptide (TPR) repeat protein
MTEKLVDGCLYEALQLKIISQWEAAGSKFEEAAQLLLPDPTEKYRAASNLEKAGDMFNRVDKGRAILVYNQAVGLFLENDKCVHAAAISVKLAEIALGESRLLDAAQMYTQACHYYEVESSVATGMQYLQKAAECHFSLANYPETIQCYKRAVEFHRTNALSGFKVPELEKKILVCEGLLLGNA